MLKQLTVFLENKPGRLEEVTGCLADEKINIHALCIADTTDFGVLRMIVPDPEKAKDALKAKGFMVKTTEVIAVAMNNTSGSLHKVLRELKDLGMSIEYMYAFTSRHKNHDAIVILRIENQEAVLEKLAKSNITMLKQGFLERLNEV